MTTDTSGGYRFKVKPWIHQRKGLRASCHAPAFALYMEQGTGKTKVIIDTAGILKRQDKIDGLCVVAPEGVQRAWVRDALPQHISEQVPYRAVWWKNKPGKAHSKLVDGVRAREYAGLRVLTINYETLITREGYAAVKSFLNCFRCLFVIDEAHRISNPKAQCSQAAYRLSDLAPYRRILTGTPVAVSPINVYGQFLFLDTEILGSRSFVAFKAHYAVLEGPESHVLRHIKMRLVAKYGEQRAAFMTPALIKRDENGMPMYRNLDELNRLIKPFTYRCLKSECMDLPPKVYVKRYVQLNAEQRKIYNDLRDDYIAEFGGETMITPLAITRLTRLQQVTGGFFKPHPDAEIMPIGKSPKLIDLLGIVEESAGKLLIWARFTAELTLIADTLEEKYGEGSVARYWGDIPKNRRDDDKNNFVVNPSRRFFVAQQKAGGTGLDGLQVANVVVFYSNELSLIHRLQPEDRGHRGGSEIHDKVTIIDIQAEDTLDGKFIDALRNHKNVADAITGDDPKGWL